MHARHDVVKYCRRVGGQATRAEICAVHESTVFPEATAVCSSCSAQIPQQPRLNRDERHYLSTSIRHHLIGHGSDNVYLMTTPEELKRFDQFLARLPPLHVVVDSLNLLYSGAQYVAKVFANKNNDMYPSMSRYRTALSALETMVC